MEEIFKPYQDTLTKSGPAGWINLNAGDFGKESNSTSFVQDEWMWTDILQNVPAIIEFEVTFTEESNVEILPAWSFDR